MTTPAIDVFVDCHAEHLAVELREDKRVGIVDDGLLQVFDHTKACRRAFSLPARCKSRRLSLCKFEPNTCP